jgi:ribosomal protein S18 acetylase RimI-like enzyme
MLKLTPVTSNDEPFLFELYVSTRLLEVAAWGWDETAVNTFLKMQWAAQRRSYETQYPDATHHLIQYNDHPAGRIMVCNSPTEFILIDISLLPQFHNQGMGSTVIQSIQNEAQKAVKPIRLSVLKHNPARRLYERLGFREISDNELYEFMEWRTV